MLFAGFDNNWSLKQLFTSKENWEPDINELPREFCSRVNSFLKKTWPRSTLLAKNTAPQWAHHPARTTPNFSMAHGKWTLRTTSAQALPYIAAIVTTESGSGSIIPSHTSTNSTSLPFKPLLIFE
jgi:hypothetical protein